MIALQHRNPPSLRTLTLPPFATSTSQTIMSDSDRDTSWLFSLLSDCCSPPEGNDPSAFKAPHTARQVIDGPTRDFASHALQALSIGSVEQLDALYMATSRENMTPILRAKCAVSDILAFGTWSAGRTGESPAARTS